MTPLILAVLAIAIAGGRHRGDRRCWVRLDAAAIAGKPTKRIKAMQRRPRRPIGRANNADSQRRHAPQGRHASRPCATARRRNCEHRTVPLRDQDASRRRHEHHDAGRFCIRNGAISGVVVGIVDAGRAAGFNEGLMLLVPIGIGVGRGLSAAPHCI